MTRPKLVILEKENSEIGPGYDAERKFRSEAIIRDMATYTELPYFALSPQIASSFENLAAALKKPMGSHVRKVARALDCFLLVTGQGALLRDKCHIQPEVALQFAGALWSGRFIEGNHKSRYMLVYALIIVCDRLQIISKDKFPQISTKGVTNFWCEKRREFEKLVLDSEQVTLCRGWPALGTFGLRWYNLRELHLCYGARFAASFHNAIQTYYSGRRTQHALGVKEFIRYLEISSEKWNAGHFTSRASTTKLFAGFALHLVKTDGETQDYTYIVRKWNKFLEFLEVAFAANLFARSYSLPPFPNAGGANRRTNIRTDANGNKWICKLITDIPIKVSDQEAIQLVLEKIHVDLDVVVQWAEFHVKNIWHRFEEWRRLAVAGAVREIGQPGENRHTAITKRTNPNWRENVAATFKHHGFYPSSDSEKKIDQLYEGLTGIAELLALPTSISLLPHMAILVIEHPKITGSFLTNLEMYDKNARLSGITDFGGSWIIDGVKLRKGPSTAQQTFSLSDRAKEVLEQVVALTQPLRKYLKEQGNPLWRRVFLHCGKGFAYPTEVLPSSLIHGCIPELTAQFEAFFSGSRAELERFVQRFSLATLRSQTVVAEYIKRPDIALVARRLGHERLNYKQLDRYIPPPLLAFFQERWVRLFQCAVLLEALKDSPYKLRATGFSSMEEVHTFLANHALQVRRGGNESSMDRTILNIEDKVVFGLSVDSIAVMESIRIAVQRHPSPCGPLSTAWAMLATRIRAFADSSENMMEFSMMFEEAKGRVNPDLYKGLLHA
ncbi:hypothetical protein [Noviherbaspirillum autotrophicum]|uniref:Uncharacterized protein n=1 Tax=Noviherbaspirillum autotrophicum TaxID=709839 RepID=A0A0C1Y814_9BURK|nr:hypothetical protein [Noviherbaspirillum autotrophicum]KIF83043.1 hypothetical protein TSA66_22945 [Noviherbaspirillum autotrophicum]